MNLSLDGREETIMVATRKDTAPVVTEVRTATGTCSAGDAFFWSPGHAPDAVRDTTDGLEPVLQHLTRG